MARPARYGLIVAALVMSACSPRNDAGTRDSAAGAIAPGPVAGTNDSVQLAASGAPAAAARLSDANILAMEEGGDSAEVAVATHARARAGDARVKEYATMLVNDHGKGLREVRAVARKLSITPQPPPGDTTSQATAHTIAHLSSLSGHDLDTAFVRHEIADHRADIADAHKAVKEARRPEVRQLVEKSLPELQKHLDRAESLERSLSARRQ